MNLEKKVVFVTGAGSGIGRELVLELLKRKASVAALDKNAGALEETAALAGALGASLQSYCVDVRDRAGVEALPRVIVARFGGVDAVINCAGIIQPFVRVSQLDYEAIDRVFDTNWRGTLYVTKAFLPWLLERPEAAIVNVSSMGGFLPVPGQTIYGASKAAVKLLTEGLQSELAGTGVRAMAVFPGAVATNIAANSGVVMKSAALAKRGSARSASGAARDILDGMERSRPRVLVGNDARLADLLYRLSPVRAASSVARQLRNLIADDTGPS
jgi:NAD(P)-dependent dehydrogenase (short-subunit alcohol dehydrogenase family)